VRRVIKLENARKVSRTFLDALETSESAVLFAKISYDNALRKLVGEKPIIKLESGTFSDPAKRRKTSIVRL